MATRPKAALLRWIHHRNSTDYSDLHDTLFGCGVGFLGRSRRAWRTVPGLIENDNDDSSIIFDEVSFQKDIMKLTQQSGKRTLRMTNWSGRPKKRFLSKEEQKVVVKQSGSRKTDAQSIETTETEDESSAQEDQSKQMEKSVRWADCTGQDLAVIVSIDSLPYVSTRVVILMLDLNERLFEFVQCEFDTDARLTISDLLKQLPSFASIEFLAQQRYRTLCRPDEEMINMLPIQNYHVREGEILVASNGQNRPKDVMAAAQALLQQKKLVRAVRKAKLSGRALQRVLSSAELLEPMEKEKNQEEPETSKLDESCDDLEESALIVKVLSRELGEDAGILNFADFSFPTFEAEDYLMEHTIDFEHEGSQGETGEGWFKELFLADDSFTEAGKFSGEAELPDFQCDLDNDLENTSFVVDVADAPQVVDAFGSSSHAWSEQDVANLSFSFTDQQFR
eukprot:scaffold6639_cov167-Amphora_coffeaeformis.AAC.2